MSLIRYEEVFWFFTLRPNYNIDWRSYGQILSLFLRELNKKIVWVGAKSISKRWLIFNNHLKSLEIIPRSYMRFLCLKKMNFALINFWF